MNIFFLVILFINFIINWYKKINWRIQNILYFVVISSFYFWLEPFYVLLVNVIILSNYFLSNYFFKFVEDKILVYLSIFINIVFLIVLKQYVFNQLFYSFKQVYFLCILLLPLRCILYTIGLNKNVIKTQNDYLVFFNYINFYPLYFLGNPKKWYLFLNKLKVKREFNRSLIVNGFRQILWGSFKVLVIARNSEIFVNQIFSSLETRSSLDLALGILFYISQAYGYLSGYFDLLSGFTKVFGISNTKALNYSFVLSPTYFWKDLYLFVNKKTKDISVNRAYIVIFLSLFILGLLFFESVINLLVFSLFNIGIVYFLNNIKTENYSSKILNFGVNIFAVFINGILIRSISFNSFMYIFLKIFSFNFFSASHLTKSALAILILIFLFYIVEWIGRKYTYGLEPIFLKYSFWLRWSFYSFIIMLIFLFN